MSFSNIKHRFQHPVLYVHLLLIVLIQFAFVECYLSSLDNVMWNISSTPVIFGNTTELSCYIADGNSSCSDGLRQWIGGQQYTSLCQNMKCSDDTKYHVKVDKPCSYTLMISNFSMYDVNCYYTCFYGIQSYRKKLQLNNNYFISFPRVIHKNVSLTGGVIDIQLYIKDVFPIPKCHAVLVGDNITNSLTEKTSTDEYFYDVQLYMFHRIDHCNGNITIYCQVGNEQITVLHEFIGNCTDINTSQGYQVAASITAGIIGITILCFGVYFWRRHRQRYNYFIDQRIGDITKLIKLTGTERRYFARVILLGKKSAGKSSLKRRLLKEKTKDVSSTDGVDIVVRQFKININDGKWAFDKGLSSDMADIFQRAKVENENKKNGLLKKKASAAEGVSKLEPNKPMIDTQNPYATESNEQSNFDIKYTSTNDIDNMNSIEHVTITDRTSCLADHENSNNSSSLYLDKDSISELCSKTPTTKVSSQLYASCVLLDFAGQKEFYAIHQTFLTNSAVYLVVADMEDDISKHVVEHWFADFCNIGEYVEFWFDYIHCQLSANTLVQIPFNGLLYPPVVMVFTGKDKYEKANMGKNKLEDRKAELETQLRNVLENCGTYHHLRAIFWLSNKTDPDKVFASLRLEISAAAMRMDDWGTKLPLKWIFLEYLIVINKNDGKNFISISDMFRLTKHYGISMGTEELVLFLRFQHEAGNIIFFEDIRDFIVLNPQWLVDIFRCLVSDKVNAKLQHRWDWTKFKHTGEISECLINELFKSKYADQFSEQVQHVVNIMLKFDILVRKGTTGSYVMPSMIPSASFDEVCKQIGIEESKCTRTSWLCLKFTFLPPAFFNHISVSFLRMYEPTKIYSRKHSIALFRGICIFDLDMSSTKLLVTLSTDTIALQLLSFSSEKQNFGSICSNIRNVVLRNTKTISQRYKLNLSYELHFKCSKGHFFKNIVSYQRLKSSTTYVCNDHNSEHQSAEIYMPWMMNIDEIQ